MGYQGNTCHSPIAALVDSIKKFKRTLIVMLVILDSWIDQIELYAELLT